MFVVDPSNRMENCDQMQDLGLRDPKDFQELSDLQANKSSNQSWKLMPKFPEYCGRRQGKTVSPKVDGSTHCWRVEIQARIQSENGKKYTLLFEHTGCPVKIRTTSFTYNFFCDRTIFKNLIIK
jgi:hypothetical protein